MKKFITLTIDDFEFDKQKSIEYIIQTVMSVWEQADKSRDTLVVRIENI